MAGWRCVLCRLGSLMLALVFLGGCGGTDSDGPDGAAFADAFGEAAEAAYADAGGDRQEDSATGAALRSCFVLSRDAAPAIAEALGVDNPGDAKLVGQPFISGRPERREAVHCTIRLGEGDQDLRVSVGTVPASNRDELLQEVRENAAAQDNEIHEIGGLALGLDGDEVLGFSGDNGGAWFIWVDDGFQIGLGLPSELGDETVGFRTLPIVVDEVASSLDVS